MYVTNATSAGHTSARDRPASEKRRYCFRRFFAFFFTFLKWGCGGVASILRSTSSALGLASAVRVLSTIYMNRSKGPRLFTRKTYGPECAAAISIIFL